MEHPEEVLQPVELPGHVCSIAPDGKIVWANTAFYELLEAKNYNTTENLHHILSLAEQKQLQNLLQALSPGRPAWQLDLPSLYTEGQWIARGFFMHDGTLQEVQLQLNSTRPRLNPQMRPSSALKFASFTIDVTKSRFTGRSKNFYASLGYSFNEEKAFCNYLQVFILPEDLRGVQRHIQELHNNATVNACIFTCRTINTGSQVNSHLVSLQVTARNRNGKPEVIEGFLQDISSAEGKLQPPGHGIQPLDGCPHLPNSTTLLVNKKLQILDYRPEELLHTASMFSQKVRKGLQLEDSLFKGIMQTVAKVATRCLAGGRVTSEVYEDPDYKANISAAPLVDKSGEYSGMVLNLHNQTAERQQQASVADFKKRNTVLNRQKTRLQYHTRDLEEQLYKAEGQLKRLQPLLEQNTLYYFSLNADLRLQDYNHAFEQLLLEMDQQVPLAERTLQHLAPEQDALKLGQILKDLQQGVTKSFQYEFKIAGPRPRWATWNIFIISPAGTQNAELVFTGLDITRYKNFEEEALKNRERFDLIARATNDAILDWDINSNEIWANPGFYRLLGLSSGTKPSLNKWMSHIHHEDRSEVISCLRDLVNSQAENWKGKYRCTLANGKEGVVYHVAVLKTDGLGNPSRMINSIMDITERETDEQLLRKITSRYEMAARAGKTGVWEWEIATNNVEADQNLQSLLGPRSVKGQPMQQWLNMVHEQDRPDLEKSLLELLENDSSHEPNLVVRMKIDTGSFRWMLVRATQLKNAQKRTERVIGSVTDITELKNVEAQLIKATRNMEEAMKAKEHFFSVMSHEIRTPLSSVIGMTYLLQQNPDDNQRKKLLSTLKFSADNLLALINDILDYNKIQVGKLEFEHNDFNLHELLYSMQMSHMPLADNKGLSLRLQIGEHVPQNINGDSTRLSQVINNLLSNAIKFTHVGEVGLTVTRRPDRQGRLALNFEVRDTGIGIPEPDQKKIFQPFQQGASETSRKYGGTGLGLAIILNLVQLQNGTISLKSRPGSGSIFNVDLCFDKAANITTGKDDSEDLPLNLSSLEGIRVLYVEDVIPNQIFMEGLCANWGIQLHLASSGRECLGLVRRHTYDIILMDIQMPDMDGYETTRHIRNMKLQKCQNVPIVALSAEVSDQAKKAVIKCGMNDYLSKPINPENLFKLLMKYTSGQKPVEAIKVAEDTHLTKAPEEGWEITEEVSFQESDRLFGSNVETYLRFLEMTRLDFEQSRDEMIRSITENDVETFRKLNHKLNGVLKILRSYSFASDLQSIKEALNDKPEELDKAETIHYISYHFGKILHKLEQKQRNLA